MVDTTESIVDRIKRIKVTKVLLKHDLFTFTQYMFLKQYKRKYADWEHLRQISEVLEKVLSGEIKRLIINIAPRYGKAIDCDTDMFTPDGWKKAGDIKVGDFLFGSDGRKTQVIGVYPQGITDAYRVTFSDGASIVTCSDHLWSMHHRYRGDRKNKDDFNQLVRTVDLVGKTHSKDGKMIWNIPIVKPIELEEITFSLPRQVERCRPLTNKHHTRRYVKKVEKVSQRETVCFTVDAKDELFCAGRDLIVTHNTELAVKAFISYALALNPRAKFIHTTYSASLALDNSSTAKDLVTSDYYQEIFPEVKLKNNQKAKQKWETTEGGGVYATSSGGQITGFGAGQVDDEVSDDDIETAINELLDSTEIDWLGAKSGFGGAIIIDDPNKPDDADSETLRNKVNERYDSTISNRVNSRNTPIIIIQQRTHEDDLSGYLIKKQGLAKDGGEWHVLTLASIKEDGTALCPQKHTIEELKKLEKHNDVVFQRQHMQNPKPKSGLLFPVDDLNFADFDEIEDILDNPDFCYAAADPANKGGDDFAAGMAPLIGNKIYIRDVIYNTKGADHNESAFADLILNRNPPAVSVEGVLGWIESANRIREYIGEGGFEGEFRVLRPRTQKHTRIMNRASFIRNHFVFRSDYADYPEYAKFMRILTSYLKIQEAGSGKVKDDAPDLCEMIGTYYENNFPHIFGLKAK